MARRLLQMSGVLVMVASFTGSGNAQEITGGVIGGVTGGVTASQLETLPPRDRAVQATGTGRVSGVVTAADTGRPLRRATVRLMAIGGMPAGPAGMRTGSTDADGRYELTELPAGRYQVVASRTGYVQMSYGQKRPFASGQPITVQDGTATVRVDIALPSAGVIAGRVLDELGEPMADVFVTAMRRQFMGAERRLVPVGAQSTTNDIGEFRLHGLAPGDYLVSASMRGAFNPTADRTGYANTFYPSATGPDQAQSVAVHAAETVSSVVIMLAPVRLNRVSGIVVDAEGQQVRAGGVTAMLRSGTAFMNSGAAIRPDGSFEISGLPDGEYTLRAMLGPIPMQQVPQQPPLQATAVVTLAGNDLSNIIVRPPRPVTLTGRVTGDPAALAVLNPGQMQVVAARLVMGDVVGPQAPARVGDDFTFALPVYPGRLSLRGMGLNGLLIESVRWNGTDVTHGFDLPEAVDGSGFEITMTNQTAKLAVLVANPTGTPFASADVLIFTDDDSWWGVNIPGHFSYGRTGQDGRFESTPLLPGRYYVAAIDGIQTFQAGDPEFLESIRARAQRISLAAGETKTTQVEVVEP